MYEGWLCLCLVPDLETEKGTEEEEGRRRDLLLPLFLLFFSFLCLYMPHASASCIICLRQTTFLNEACLCASLAFALTCLTTSHIFTATISLSFLLTCPALRTQPPVYALMHNAIYICKQGMHHKKKELAEGSPLTFHARTHTHCIGLLENVSYSYVMVGERGWRLGEEISIDDRQTGNCHQGGWWEAEYSYYAWW